MSESLVSSTSLLPSDAWVLVALKLLNTVGRNGVIALSCVNKELKDIILNHSPLWREIILSYFFRLLSKADGTVFSQFSASHSRRLLRCLLACDITPEPIIIDGESYKPGRLAWVPAWIRDYVAEGSIAEGHPSKEPGKWGEVKVSHATWESMRRTAAARQEEELLLYDGDIIYKFGYDVNTTEFWFSHEKAADGTPLSIRIGDLLNADAAGAFSALSESSNSILDNQELLQSFAKIVPGEASDTLATEPVLEVTACLTPIVPEFIPSTSEENILLESIVVNDPPANHPRNMSVYRYVMPRNSLPFIDMGSNDVIHLLLPLQDPDRRRGDEGAFNEDRIKYYQDQMRSGAFPTVAAVTKVCPKYRLIEKGHKIIKQLIVVSFVVDGHHKLEAAARLKWPVGLLMFADHDRDFNRLRLLNQPVPSWPFNERERNTYFPTEGPFTLMYNNLDAPVPELEAENRKAAIKKTVSCGDSNPDCVKRVIIPSSMKGWRNCLFHGGMIEFDSQESMIRALIYAQGQPVEGDDPIALQIPTSTSSFDWNMKFDLSTHAGVLYEHPPSDDEDEPSSGQRYV